MYEQNRPSHKEIKPPPFFSQRKRTTHSESPGLPAGQAHCPRASASTVPLGLPACSSGCRLRHSQGRRCPSTPSRARPAFLLRSPPVPSNVLTQREDRSWKAQRTGFKIQVCVSLFEHFPKFISQSTLLPADVLDFRYYSSCKG